VAGRFRHLVKFGSGCFSSREYEDRVRVALAEYYRFLAKGLTTPQGLEMLRYHRSALERIGYRFDGRRLMTAILPYWWYGIRHPFVMARLLSRLPATLAPTSSSAAAMPKAEQVAKASAHPVSEHRVD
jgi:hypothetical protein